MSLSRDGDASIIIDGPSLGDKFHGDQSAGLYVSRDALLEVVVLLFDDGREMAIHAMKMQRRYRRYLPRSQ